MSVAPIFRPRDCLSWESGMSWRWTMPLMGPLNCAWATRSLRVATWWPPATGWASEFRKFALNERAIPGAAVGSTARLGLGGARARQLYGSGRTGRGEPPPGIECEPRGIAIIVARELGVCGLHRSDRRRDLGIAPVWRPTAMERG